MSTYLRSEGIIKAAENLNSGREYKRIGREVSENVHKNIRRAAQTKIIIRVNGQHVCTLL